MPDAGRALPVRAGANRCTRRPTLSDVQQWLLVLLSLNARGACVIRIVATILVTVQALLPPGMCFCQFVHFGQVTPHHAHESTLAPKTVASVDESGCSCPACRPAASAATSQIHEQVVASTETAREHRPPSAPTLPSPNPQSPCSGCPVVAAGPIGRVVIPTVTEQAPLGLAARFVERFVEVVAPRANRPAPALYPTTQPLFVRHCALLI